MFVAGKECDMDYYSMSGAEILKELGNRIRNERLNANLSQNSLAVKAGVALRVLQNIEYGKTVAISNFLRVMRALNVLEQLDSFLPKSSYDPLEIVKLEGKRRKRASKNEASKKG